MDPVKKLRKIAMALPEAEEGTSCNKAAFRAGKKAFLYVGEKSDEWNVMLKLIDSAGEASKLADKHPDRFSINDKGWVSASFAPKTAPPAGLFERWIVESYRALAPKSLVAALDETATASRKKKR